MDCTQENDLMPLLIELGILPCLGLMLLIVGLFYILVNYIGREKPGPREDEDAGFDLLLLLLGTIMLVVGIAYLAGAILLSLLNSGLNGQPLHWY